MINPDFGINPSLLTSTTTGGFHRASSETHSLDFRTGVRTINKSSSDPNSGIDEWTFLSP